MLVRLAKYVPFIVFAVMDIQIGIQIGWVGRERDSVLERV